MLVDASTRAGYYSHESKITRAALRLKTRITSHAAEDSLLLGTAPLPPALGDRAPCTLGATHARRTAEPSAPSLRSPAFGLPLDDFRARFSLLSIHVWMILVRLRSEGKTGEDLGQARAAAQLVRHGRRRSLPV